MKRKTSIGIALLLTATAMFSGCGMAGWIAEETLDEMNREISQSVGISIGESVGGFAERLVSDIVDDVISEVFDDIAAGLAQRGWNQKEELIAFDAAGEHLYTVTDNEVIFERVQNSVRQVMQWKRSRTVPENASLLYQYELWQEDQNSPLPEGERPLVLGMEMSLYEAGSRYYFQVVIHGDSDSVTDGWYLPRETAENIIEFTKTSAH